MYIGDFWATLSMLPCVSYWPHWPHTGAARFNIPLRFKVFHKQENIKHLSINFIHLSLCTTVKWPELLISSLYPLLANCPFIILTLISSTSELPSSLLSAFPHLCFPSSHLSIFYLLPSVCLSLSRWENQSLICWFSLQQLSPRQSFFNIDRRIPAWIQAFVGKELVEAVWVRMCRGCARACKFKEEVEQRGKTGMFPLLP